MPDLPDILAHAVLEPDQWLVLRVDRNTDDESLKAMGDAIPDELRGRTMIVAEPAIALQAVDGWVWCGYWHSTPFQHPDDCADCPGPHRTVLLGMPLDEEDPTDG